MPGRAGFESDVERNPSVGIDRLCGRSVHRDCDSPPEILINIGRAKACASRCPLRGDPASANHGIGFDFEEVGEVTTNADFQIKLHCF